MPHECEPTLWRAVTTTQNVVKGVEIVTPLGTWNQDTANLCVEAIQIMNSRTVEFEIRDGHALIPPPSLSVQRRVSGAVGERGPVFVRCEAVTPTAACKHML